MKLRKVLQLALKMHEQPLMKHLLASDLGKSTLSSFAGEWKSFTEQMIPYVLSALDSDENGEVQSLLDNDVDLVTVLKSRFVRNILANVANQVLLAVPFEQSSLYHRFIEFAVVTANEQHCSIGEVCLDLIDNNVQLVADVLYELKPRESIWN